MFAYACNVQRNTYRTLKIILCEARIWALAGGGVQDNTLLPSRPQFKKDNGILLFASKIPLNLV